MKKLLVVVLCVVLAVAVWGCAPAGYYKIEDPESDYLKYYSAEISDDFGWDGKSDAEKMALAEEIVEKCKAKESDSGDSWSVYGQSETHRSGFLFKYVSTDNVIELDVPAEATSTATTAAATNDMEREISDEDYELYNEVMDILNSDWSRSEDEILEEIAPNYSMTASELKQFLNDNMEAAINRSMGKTKSATANKPDFIELISYAETILEDATEMPVDVSTREPDWDISEVGLRYVLESVVDIDGTPTNVIVKIEFDDDKYESYTVFQLKVNGVDIPV